MYRTYIFVLALGLVSVSQPALAQMQNKTLSAQSFSGEVTVNASPAHVWQVLTDASKLTQILGYDYVGGSKHFTRPGDVARVKVWGDAGNFTLVRNTSSKELRFNLDPENASYICNCRWEVLKSSNGTKVRYHERYTESSPQSPAEIAAQVKAGNAMFQRLKALAEK